MPGMRGKKGLRYRKYFTVVHVREKFRAGFGRLGLEPRISNAHKEDDLND